MNLNRKADEALVELTGRIIFDNLMATQEALREVAESGVRRVFVKMDAVSYLDSSALGMLLSFNTTATNSGVEITLLAPPPHIRAIFSCTHLDNIFNILGDAEANEISSGFAA